MVSLFGKKHPAQPQGGIPPVLLSMRETLYSTSSLEPFVSRIQSEPRPGFPWSNFMEAQAALEQNDRAQAIGLLKQVTAAEGLETRLYLQAWHSLRALGELPPEALRGQIQGVIIENHMEQGLDLLAAYSDHTARYWNHSGAGIVWDQRDPEIDNRIDYLLYVGQEIMKWIGINQNENLPVPPPGSFRVFMTGYGGSCSGEGPYEQLAQDETAGYAVQGAYNLMMSLIQKAGNGQ